LFAFERLAFEYPEQQRVKLELARALLQSGNYSASRQLFNEVLASRPTENVRANIETYLALVDSREKASGSSFDWHISTAIGSDSNINSATELGVISTPIGDVELNPDGQSLRDEYTEIAAGMTYVRPFSKT